MKFKCHGSVLANGLSIVERAISARSSLAVLENVYLSLANGVLTLRGNDLELGIETTVPVEATQDGAVLLKAKTLGSIVSKLQNQMLSIEMDEGCNVVLSADDRVDFHILGVAADEYPVFPAIESGSQMTVSVEDMKQLIGHTIFAVSFDETKQFLNGILIKTEGNTLSFVATDGYRLSLKTQSLPNALAQDFSAIVPFKVMNEFNKILGSSDPATTFDLTVSENQVAFKLNETVCISRVIQGQFPDYKQVLPKEAGQSFSVSRRGFLEACERASIIAFASNNVVRLSFEGDKMCLQANAAGMGDFKEYVPMSRLSGEGDARIAFNVRLILDSIKNLQMDDIKIEFNNELSPCVIKPISDLDYTYIIMPIRTSDYHNSPQNEEAAVPA